LAAGKRERYQVEKRYITKDGRVVWGRLHVSLARNLAGAPEFAVSLVEDITARKEAQAALAESEARYRSLVEMSPDAIVVHAKGRIIFANPAGLKLFGASGAEEILGQPILNLVHPDFREIVKRRVSRGYAGERSDLREIKIWRLDGRVLDVETTAVPITYQGRPAVQVVVRDITARKQAEAELARQKDLLQAIIDNIPVMLTIYDPQVKSINFNRELRRVLGWTEADMDVDDPLTLFYPDPDYRQEVLAFMQSLEPGWRDFQVTAKDGSLVDSTWANVRLTDNTRIGIGVDIRERKLAEEALRQSEARYRAIGELIPFGIWRATPDGGWDYVSKSFLKMTGKTLEELQGFGWLHLLPYGDTQTTLKAWQQCLETGSFWDYEYKIQSKDGSYRTVLSRGLPLADRQGRITSWVGINLDITERKEMEEDLRRAQKELERRVEERTAALRLANEELLGEMKERSEVELRLRQSEARFAAFMQYLPGAAVMRDVQGRYIFVNETWERLTGQKPGEWLEKTAQDIWSPERARNVREADFAVLSKGEPAETLEELELPDGQHYFLIQRFPIPDESGLPYMVGSIAIDVTDRQRAEEALAAERQRFFDLLENLPAFIYLQAQDYSLRFANRQFRQRFGEPDGAACYTLMWSRDEPCPECPTFSVFHTGKPLEWEWTAPDSRIYQVYDYPFADVDGLPLVLEMGIDITDRKQAETEAARQAALVAGINRVLREALTSETEEELGRTCLAVAEELTDSRFGFIDEVNEQGTFDALAFSDPGWEMCRISSVKDLTHLRNVQPAGLLARSIRDGRALMTNDPASHPDAAGIPAGHPPLTAFLGVPLTSGNQTIGLLGLGNKAGGYSDADRETAEILAPVIVEAIMHHRAAKDLKRSESKMRYLADQLLTAQENERKRLASELHDELGHALLALKLALGSIARELLPTQENLKEELQNQLDYIGEVIDEVRRLYHDLSPGNVEDLGLTKALRTLVEDFGDLLEDIDWEVDLADLDGYFSLPVQTIIYRLVQEALTNIGKHAEPEHVRVSAAPTDGRVHFVIQDDGVGFDVSEILHSAAGLGLVAMEERLNMVGGTFEVWSKPKEGTKISFSIPT
ncbi:MAG: PAS domain S-box protein, partial [Thermodesulfobacteriota bacterium]